MINFLALAMRSTMTADPLRFLLGFLVLCCVIAVVIILVRWLASLAGITIPPPLMLVLGILFFLILLFWLLNYSGVYSF